MIHCGRFLLRRAASFSSSKANISQKLMEASLSYVPVYGWSDRSIMMACSALDLSPAAHRLISPYQMIAFSMRKWNKQSLRIIDDTNFGINNVNEQKNDQNQLQKQEKNTTQKSTSPMGITKKIGFSIKTRLTQELQVIDTWHEAMAIGAKLENIATTKQILWEYSDQIWRRCGDRSTDYNYYSKRVLFNAVYASTELHLLTDQSPNKFATWDFMQRRLKDVTSMGRTISDVSVVANAAFNGLTSLVNLWTMPSKIQNSMQDLKSSLKETKSEQVKDSKN